MINNHGEQPTLQKGVNSNLKATEWLPKSLAREHPWASPTSLGSVSLARAVTHLSESPEVQRSEGRLDLKAEGRAQLRDAHAASCGEERKAHQHLRVPHMAIKCRCQGIDKDMAILVKLLDEVKMSTGHLTQT